MCQQYKELANFRKKLELARSLQRYWQAGKTPAKRTKGRPK
jgi:hypothetical protein